MSSLRTEPIRVWLHRAFFLALVLVFLHEYPNVVRAHELVQVYQAQGLGCLPGFPCPLDEANTLYNTAFARLSLVVLGLMATDRAFINAVKVLKRAFLTDWLKEDKSAMAPAKFSLALLYVIGFVAGAGILLKNLGWLI